MQNTYATTQKYNGQCHLQICLYMIYLVSVSCRINFVFLKHLLSKNKSFTGFLSNELLCKGGEVITHARAQSFTCLIINLCLGMKRLSPNLWESILTRKKRYKCRVDYYCFSDCLLSFPLNGATASSSFYAIQTMAFCGPSKPLFPGNGNDVYS